MTPLLRTCAGLALAALTTTAVHAEPAAAAQKSYAAELKRGRQLERSGNAAGAVAAFQAALAAAPGDAVALSELGVAAQKAGDLALAERATRQSIASTKDHQLKGASLFNLGAILLQAGNRAGAVAAYKDSLAARKNGTVWRALAALDANAAAAVDPFAPTAMVGPYPSLQGFFAALRADSRAADAPYDREGRTLAKPPAPYREVRVLAARSEPDEDDANAAPKFVEYYLALLLDGGWFVTSAPIASAINDGSNTTALFIDELAAREIIKGGAPEIVVRCNTRHSYMHMGDEEASDVTELFIGGIGPSGRPSATAGMPIERVPSSPGDGFLEGAERQKQKQAVQFRLPGDGVEIASVPRSFPAELRSVLPGKHVLIFP